MKKSITYFEQSGSGNTDETIKLAYERALELNIRDIVVASTHGRAMSKEERAKLQAKGVKVLTGIHALGDDVSSAFTEKFGGKSFNEIVAQTLYRFCQGMKVCVEIVLMAADAGLISVDGEVIAIAGTGEGADTAIVVTPAYPRKFLDLKVKEVIAKPWSG